MSTWTKEHIAALRALEGKTLREMADALIAYRPITENTARGACLRYGVRYSYMPIGWPAEHDAVLRKMAGSTGGQIVKVLRKLRPDVTRNAVIGRAARIGVALSGEVRGAAIASKKRIKPKPAPKPKLVMKVTKTGAPRHADKPPPPYHGRPDAWAPLTGSKPVSLLDRAPMCCAWPVETEGDLQMFCGVACPDEAPPYCAEHRRMRLARYVPTYLRDAEKAAA